MNKALTAFGSWLTWFLFPDTKLPIIMLNTIEVCEEALAYFESKKRAGINQYHRQFSS